MIRAAQRTGVIAVILVCCLYLLWPILKNGQWYHAMQAYRYPYLFDLFKESFVNGHLYPRWLPELMGGYGYPTFVFYPPGFWFAALPFSLFFDFAPDVMRVTLVVIFMIGGFGAWRLARHFELAPVYAVTCAALFLFTPYITFQLNGRGSFAELQALLLFPWVLLWFLRLAEAVEAQRALLKPALWLAISFAAALYSHPTPTIWMTLGLVAVFCQIFLRSVRRKELVVAFTAAALLALALSSPYWLSFPLLKGDIHYQSGLYWVPPNHFKIPFDFTSRFINPVLAAAALAGFLFSRRKPYALPALLVCIVLLLMVTTNARTLWEQTELLRYVQLPYRLLSPYATFQLIGLIYLMKLLPAHIPRPLRIGFLLALLAAGLLQLYPYSSPKSWMNYVRFEKRVDASFNNMTHYSEFTPTYASSRDLKSRLKAKIPPVKVLRGEKIPKVKSRGDDISFTVRAPVKLRVNQFWFPGWKAAVDGHASHPGQWRLDRNGRMLINIEGRGKKEVRIWYDGPPYWLARNLTALVIIFAVLAGLRHADTGRRNPRLV